MRLSTYHGLTGRLTLLVRLLEQGVGFVTIYNDTPTGGRVYLTPFRSVFERLAPRALERVEALIPVGKGNSIYQLDDQLLEALTDAYREAACAGPERLSGH